MNTGIESNTLVLNQNQLEATNWNEGPLLVLAGPGSGKTTVLTQRIIRLIKEHPDERFRILALTFTQNAARHMRSKIDQEIAEGRERAYLSTFHSFCADVIRQHGQLEEISTDFSIMTMDLDREELLLEIIAEQASSGKDFKKEDIRLLPKINSLLEQCIIIDDLPDLDSEINRAKYLCHYYIEKMRISGRIDYSGILYFAWKLLCRKQIAKHYNIVYKYICVDEYQDTNLAQFMVLTQLVKEKEPNLFVVADDDQIVYQWNGANPERLNEIVIKYNMTIVQLPENHRCPNHVVNIANRMIANNKNRYAFKLPGESLQTDSSIESVTVKGFHSFQDEITWVAEDIRSSHRSPQNTKIMGRTRKLLQDAQEILTQVYFPAAVYQRKSEFESPPLRFLHALLRLFVSRADKVQLQRLSSAFYQIEGVNIDIHYAIGLSALTGGDLLRAWFKAAQERPEISAETSRYLLSMDFDRDFANYENRIAEYFDLIVKLEDGEVQNKEIYDNYKSEKEIWNSLFEEIKTSTNNSLTLSGFLQELDLRDKAVPIPFGAYELITIHGAKGLEFDHVYLIGMVNDILPTYNSIKKGARPESLEEERRSCYVAITRTQKTLTMTYSDTYGSWDKSPSIFLYEMGLLT